jgi:hypothetical protein
VAEPPQRSGRPYLIAVGVAFAALVVYAGVNAIRTTDDGVLGLGAQDEGTALAEFAVPDARSELTGDANVAQDDCESATRPCPEGERRTPACRVDEPGAIRVCDLFDRPSVISFWFTRGGDCEGQQDEFETAYRRFGSRVDFLAINVRDSRDDVRELISERGWTHPVGLDPDGALSNLYLVGGCPTFLYVYPGGILKDTSIGELDAPELAGRVEALIADSERRASR